MRIYFIVVFSALVILSSTGQTMAVPPPDFLFSLGSQIVQIFSLVVIFLSALLVSIKQFASVYFARIKHKKVFWGTMGGIVIIIAFSSAYFYQQYAQTKAYEQWVAQSKEQDQQFSQEIIKNAEASQTETQAANAQSQQNISAFFEANQQTPIAISNEEFKQVLSMQNAVFVLDARENEEYEIGRFPGSTHIRFADLKDGQWQSLPKDQIIYVFCWSGMRGKDVADFLRTQKIVARYIEKGADGWVKANGQWEGGIKFSSSYSADRYQKLYNLDEFKKAIKDGAVIIDSREQAKYDIYHVPASISIPMLYTPSNKIVDVLAQVPAGKAVITICDDFMSCFDAKVTGIKLEKAGHTFLGRYNKPWEFRANPN